eukprot:scaffold96784_cov43-Cyclotella_meneghiniana.AAC.1
MKPPYAGDMPRIPIHWRIPIPTPVAHQSRVICRLYAAEENCPSQLTNDDVTLSLYCGISAA